MFATLCILLACCAESPVESTLRHVSSLLPDYPDSAEVVLNSIPAGNREAEDARIALYRVWIAYRRAAEYRTILAGLIVESDARAQIPSGIVLTEIILQKICDIDRRLHVARTVHRF